MNGLKRLEPNIPEPTVIVKAFRKDQEAVVAAVFGVPNEVEMEPAEGSAVAVAVAITDCIEANGFVACPSTMYESGSVFKCPRITVY